MKNKKFVKDTNPDQDIIEFVNDIQDRLKDRLMQGKIKDGTIGQVVRDMVASKLKKEGWKKLEVS